jgi:uncharacterized protein YjbI with pentapeptide repeats
MPAPPEHHSPVVHDSRIAPASVDLADAVVQGVRAAFGILSLGIGVAVRTLGESPEAVPRRPGLRVPAADVADLVVGTAWGAARLSGRLAAAGARVTAPAIGLVLRPPLLPRRLQPAHRAQLMVERWQRDRPETLRTLGRWSASALPGMVDAALEQVDVEQVATVVLDRVDLDVLVADVVRRLDITAITLAVLQGMDLTRIATAAIENTDLDRAVNDALGRLDVDEVAARLLDQLDLTRLVLDRVDMGQVVAGALDRLDLTSIVVDQVDLGGVIAAALQQVDLTQVVVDQVDLGGVIAAALQQVDLTQVVVDQVDLGGVIAAALQQVDLTQVVMQQVDLLGVAEYVVEGIDLPDIIRDSTGSVASEAVVGLRLQGVDADVVVGRVVDRMLRRHRERRSEKAPLPVSSPDTSADPPRGIGHE